MSKVIIERDQEELFAKADHLLFKEGKHEQAHEIYKQILDQDKNNIDAINSVAYCIKFSAKTGVN